MNIKRLNLLLKDYLGTTPTGDGLYKWIHTRDRALFCHLGRLDGITPKVQYEYVPQVNEVRWTLAMWQAPPSERMWELQFGGQVAYPRGGYYTAASTPGDALFERGLEPNEGLTMQAIGLRKKQLQMGVRGVREAINEQQVYKNKERDRIMDDILSNQWTPHVPGTCDHISYPSA